MTSRRALICSVLGMMWLASGLFVPVTHAQPPAQAPAPWIDAHLHLVGGRGQQQDFAGAADAAIHEMDRFGIAMALAMPPPQVDQQPVYDASAFVGALQRHRGRFAHLGGGGPGVSFAERNTPKLQATVHFLSLLPPEVAVKIGRENAIWIYKLPAR